MGKISDQTKYPLDSVLTGTEYLIGTDTDLTTKTFSIDQIKDYANSFISQSKFLGVYTSLTALQTAHPSPDAGSYGYVDEGVGTDIVVYVWDDTDNTYVQSGTGTTELDPIFSASPSATITNTDISNWNTAYSLRNNNLANFDQILPDSINRRITLGTSAASTLTVRLFDSNDLAVFSQTGIAMGIVPTIGDHLTNKTYVDSQLTSKLGVGTNALTASWSVFDTDGSGAGITLNTVADTVQIYGPGVAKTILNVATDEISVTNYDNSAIDAVGANSLITKSYADANYSGGGSALPDGMVWFQNGAGNNLNLWDQNNSGNIALRLTENEYVSGNFRNGVIYTPSLNRTSFIGGDESGNFTSLDLTDTGATLDRFLTVPSLLLTPTDVEPTSTKGALYFDDSESTLKQYNGTAWESVGGNGGGIDAGYTLINNTADYTFSTTNVISGNKRSLTYVTDTNTVLGVLGNIGSTGDLVTVDKFSSGSTHRIIPDNGVTFKYDDGTDSSGGNNSITVNSTSTAVKESANTWVWRGDYAPASFTSIETTYPIYDFNAQSLSLGAVSSWTNDGSGVATVAEQSTGSLQPTCIDESGSQAVSFDGVDDILNLNIGTPSDLDFNIGVDDFTIIVVRGSTVATTGTYFGDRDASERNINIGSTAADNFLVQIGQTGQFFDTGISSTGGLIYEVSVDAASVDTYVGGTSSLTGQTASGEVAQNTFHIGGRSNGTAYLNGSIRRILVWDRLLTASERTAIVAQLQTENLATNTDSDAQAFIDAVGTLTASEETAIDNLVKGLKTNGTWSSYDAIYPFIGGTAAEHKWNLKNPLDTNAAFRMVFNGTWTHDANGITGGGTTADYADTFFTPLTSGNLSNTSANISIYLRNSLGASTRTYIGSSDTSLTNNYFLGMFSSGTRSVGSVGGNSSPEYTPSTASAEVVGLNQIVTNGTRDAQHWKNGVKNGATIAQTGTATPVGTIIVGAINSNGNEQFPSAQTFSFAAIGTGLTDTQVADDYTTVQAYQTELGRQV